MSPERLGMTPDEWLGAAVCVVALVVFALAMDRVQRRRGGRR